MPDPVTGQVSLGGSPQRLSTIPPNSTAYVIKAPLSNAADAYVGDENVTAGNGHVLSPGDSFTYERSDQNGQTVYQLDVSDFYAVGSSGDVISWLASP